MSGRSALPDEIGEPWNFRGTGHARSVPLTVPERHAELVAGLQRPEMTVLCRTPDLAPGSERNLPPRDVGANVVPGTWR